MTEFVKSVSRLGLNIKESRLSVVFDCANRLLDDLKVEDNVTYSKSAQKIVSLAQGVASLENLCTKKFKSLDAPEQFYSKVLEFSKSTILANSDDSYLVTSTAELLRLTRIADKELLAVMLSTLGRDQGNSPWHLMKLGQFGNLLQYFAQNVYILKEQPECLDMILAWSFNYLDLMVSENNKSKNPEKLFSWEYSQLCRILWSLCVLFEPSEITDHMSLFYKKLGLYLAQGEDNLVNLSQIAL